MGKGDNGGFSQEQIDMYKECFKLTTNTFKKVSFHQLRPVKPRNQQNKNVKIV